MSFLVKVILYPLTLAHRLGWQADDIGRQSSMVVDRSGAAAGGGQANEPVAVNDITTTTIAPDQAADGYVGYKWWHFVVIGLFWLAIAVLIMCTFWCMHKRRRYRSTLGKTRTSISPPTTTVGTDGNHRQLRQQKAEANKQHKQQDASKSPVKSVKTSKTPPTASSSKPSVKTSETSHKATPTTGPKPKS